MKTKLTDTYCKNAQSKDKPYKIFDSEGLYFEVMPNGSKYFRFKYRFGGKERRIAFGVYPRISLKEAREKRAEAQKLLSQNIDPGIVKKEEKQKLIMSQANSFESIAREWFEKKKAGITEKHAKKIWRKLELDALPYIGKRPISEIRVQELLIVFKRMEERGVCETTHRVAQFCSQIFKYAAMTGRSENDPVSLLKGALKTKKTENYRCIKEKEFPAFLCKLKEYPGNKQTQLALQLIILTFVRTGELRGATWDEIHWDKKEWRIPAGRMKMREEHIVPLSEQAIRILKELSVINGNTIYIFPNQNNPSKIMSENTMLDAVERMGYKTQTTVHGFRATASTILNEKGFRPDVIERQLAHAERNKVRAVYNRAEYMPERKKMMQWWADYLDAIVDESNNVVVGKFGKVA